MLHRKAKSVLMTGSDFCLKMKIDKILAVIICIGFARVASAVSPPNLFALDYWGPLSGTTTAGGAKGFTNISDGYLLTYYNNFVGAKDLGDNTNAWFEIHLRPDRDSTNRRPHYLSFRLGVLGGSTEKVTVYYTYSIGGNTNLVELLSTTGTGWPTSFRSVPQSWTTWNITPGADETNDLILRFVYSTGTVTTHNFGANIGGVDNLTWEPVPQAGDQIKLRFESDASKVGSPVENVNTTTGTLSHSFRISWPRNNLTDYTLTNRFKIEGSTNLNTWVPLNTQFTSYPILQDSFGIRYITYILYVDSVPMKYWRLRQQ